MMTFEYFDKKIGCEVWGKVNEYLHEENTQIKQDLVFKLKEYFYFHQYDEDKYPHFRACDRDYEYDESGIKHYYFIFYDDAECEYC